MRHRIKGRKLNRTASHKKALIRNLANQLFEHKEIKTTTSKAKEARVTVERLITYAKKGDTHHRRLAFSFLRQKETIKTLFDEIAPTFAERQGGYTRVIKLGRRQGDGAPMAILQLVGFETLADTSKPEKKKKSRKKEEKQTDIESKAVATADSVPEDAQVAEVLEETPGDSEEVAEEKPTEDVKSEEGIEEVAEVNPAEEVKPVEKSEKTEEQEPVKAEEKVEEKDPEQEVKQEEVEEETEVAKKEDSEPEEDKKDKKE